MKHFNIRAAIASLFPVPGGIIGMDFLKRRIFRRRCPLHEDGY